MNISEFRDVADRITYKPGWHIHVESLAHIGQVGLRASFTAPCAVESGKPRVQMSGLFLFSLQFMQSVDDVIRAVYRVIQAAERHELDEFFKVDGRAIFDPHRVLVPELEAV